MKKLVLCMSALVALPTFATEQPSSFIGGFAGASNINEGRFKEWGVGGGVRSGLQGDNFRVYANLDYTGMKKETKNEEKGITEKHQVSHLGLTANADYLVTLTPEFKLFVGPHVGALRWDANLSYEGIGDGGELKYNKDPKYKPTVGVQAGALFDVNDQVNLEVGYRSSWYKLDDPKYRESENENEITTKEKVGRTANAYAAVNFMF